MKQVIELHPDWEIRFYSDGDCRDLIAERCPGFLELYDWYPRPVQRADFFRILSVHLLGGFYLDTDMWLSKSLDELCGLTAVFPWERIMSPQEFSEKFPSGQRQGEQAPQVGNYAFGAREGHGILALVTKEMIALSESISTEHCSDSDVLFSTGPDLLSKVIYRNLEKFPDLTILDGDHTLEVPFPDPAYERYGQWFRFGDYGTHLMSGAWRKFDL